MKILVTVEGKRNEGAIEVSDEMRRGIVHLARLRKTGR